jgi:hypothetical protein
LEGQGEQSDMAGSLTKVPFVHGRQEKESVRRSPMRQGRMVKR